VKNFLSKGGCFIAAWGVIAVAQTPPPANPVPVAPNALSPAPPPAGADPTVSPTLDPMARELLQTLHDRRNTLKDFTAKIDYSVKHPVTEEVSGKRGTVDFLIDPVKGPIFSVDFTVDTDEDGKAKRTHHQQIIFDGVDMTTKDFQPREFTRSRMLPDGAQPGDAVTLNGPMTLPIGLNVDDVARNFQVTVVPASDPNLAELRLIPRTLGKFDFKQLDFTVDRRLELPVKMVQTAKGRDGDVTTIQLSDIQPNTGKARMQDPTPGPGWTERGGGGGGTGAARGR
jgi:hypothetical protein